MNLTKLLSFIGLIILCLSNNIKAQDCGSEAVHQYLLKTNPKYQERFNSLQAKIRSKLSNKQFNGKSAVDDSTIYTIPVVFHIFHTGEPVGTGNNISDEQILGSIQGLNERYSNVNGSGLDMGIRFCMAVRDPDGCPTNGINRIDASAVPKYAANGVAYGDTIGAPDYLLKDMSKWPVSDYYNIWVVNKINGGWAGYAYYPWGAEYDGAIMHHTYTAYQYPTLAHELGHALFLAHTFNGDNGNKDCPLNLDCTQDGDWICDTPPHKQGDCGGTDTCYGLGDWDNSRYNYMSYCFPSGSLYRFTPDQKDRVRQTMLEYPRAALVNSLGCVPSDFNTEIVRTNVTCSGGCDGSIILVPTCSSEYRFQWDNGDTLQSISNLCAGTYVVTITNADKLTTSFPVIISEPDDITVNINITKVGCKGAGDGEAIAAAFGGTPFYKYNWSNGQNQKTATGLSEGLYLVTVTDFKGCTKVDTLDMIPNPLPVVDAGKDVIITEGFSTVLGGIPASKGNGPFTYEWFPVTALDSIAIANPLAKPVENITYYLQVTDVNGCMNYDSVSVVVIPSAVNEHNNDLPLISVSPNPGQDYANLTVTNIENGAYTLKITSMAGQKVYETSLLVNSHTLKQHLSLSELSKGSYLITLETGNKKLSVKLLKQ